MAAGVAVNVYGRSYNVNSNSCTDVRAALDAWQIQYNYAGRTVSCSTDPVAAGTFITFNDGGGWGIQSITATATEVATPPSAPASAASMDFASTPQLLQAVLVVAVVFILFMGFRAGDKT